MKDNKIMSEFQFIDSYIKNSNIKIYNRNIKNSKLELGVEVNVSEIKENKDELSAELRLKNIIKIRNQNEDTLVEIEVEMAGIFKAHNMDKNKFMQFMKFSGTPIISQSIRSYVMNISALSGIDTIRIPLINYVEFFKNNDENVEKNKEVK